MAALAACRCVNMSCQRGFAFRHCARSSVSDAVQDHLPPLVAWCCRDDLDGCEADLELPPEVVVQLQHHEAPRQSHMSRSVFQILSGLQSVAQRVIVHSQGRSTQTRCSRRMQTLVIAVSTFLDGLP